MSTGGDTLNKIRVISLLLAGCLLFSGCNKDSFNRNSGKADSEATEVGSGEPLYVSSLDELESGNYYVFHDGNYYKPVWDVTSFKTTDTGENTGHTAWFDDVTNCTIPTMYEGDYLVYFVDEAFKETFSFDRYQYVGYTIGICNMRELSSGRYSFDAVYGNENINSNSDAARLMDIDAKGVIIDTIGKAELRSGNIAPGGSIVGLKGNEYYSAEIYVGTELKKYTLCADTIAYTSMESWSTNDYTFLKSKIIRINFPESLNSGYYSVNGSGIFRYVSGRKYDSKTDFNVPNDLTNVQADKGGSSQKKIEEETDESVEKEFTVKRESDVTIQVEYKDELQANFKYDAPVIKVIGTSAVYTLKETGNNVFCETLHLTAGRYRLVITGMSGRAYDYMVTSKEAD